MALLPLSSRTENFPSFASWESPQIYHRRSGTFSLRLPIRKVLISPTVTTDVFAFLSGRSETVKSKPRSQCLKKYRSGCYGRSITCGVCTTHAAANEKVLVIDDKMDQRTLYDMLGVSRKAEAKDIKAAYRQQVRRLHPDVAPLDKRKEFTRAFLKIHNAYTTLANPRSRAWYDSQLSAVPYHASSDCDGNHWGISRASSINESSYVTAAETSTAYPWARTSSNWKGRNWETDQCW